jgi:hypothetical protein
MDVVDGSSSPKMLCSVAFTPSATAAPATCPKRSEALRGDAGAAREARHADDCLLGIQAIDY